MGAEYLIEAYFDFRPFIEGLDDINNIEVIPYDPYYVGKVTASVILFGLIVDSFMLAGIYRKYEIYTDLFYPWLIFYPILVIGKLFVGAK